MQVELLAVKCANINAIEVAELTIFLSQQTDSQPNSQQFNQSCQTTSS